MVGHDWGAVVAWSLCLLRPDLVKALVNLSVVFNARHPSRRPVDSIRAIFGEDHYICRFQASPFIKSNYVIAVKISYRFCKNGISVFRASLHFIHVFNPMVTIESVDFYNWRSRIYY